MKEMQHWDERALEFMSGKLESVDEEFPVIEKT
jgi:hypothetical protein